MPLSFWFRLPAILPDAENTVLVWRILGAGAGVTARPLTLMLMERLLHRGFGLIEAARLEDSTGTGIDASEGAAQVNAQALFLHVARAIRRAPNFRRKIRALLFLYKILGLGKRHIIVETTVHRPIPYRARLDLYSKHERFALLMDGYEADTTRFRIVLSWVPVIFLT
jgi:hypothetical protein